MTGIIYYENIEEGLKQIDRLKENYKRIKIEVLYSSVTHRAVSLKFDNGDYWRMVRISDNARGLCCNIAYIPINLKDTDIYFKILPTVKGLPFTGIQFY